MTDNRIVTLRMLVGRLNTVRRRLDDPDNGSRPAKLRVDGAGVAPTTDNILIDHNGELQITTGLTPHLLSASPLTEREAIELEAHLSDLARFLGAPGDWGYSTKLGRFTQEVHRLLVDIRRGVVVADDGQSLHAMPQHGRPACPSKWRVGRPMRRVRIRRCPRGRP